MRIVSCLLHAFVCCIWFAEEEEQNERHWIRAKWNACMATTIWNENKMTTQLLRLNFSFVYGGNIRIWWIFFSFYLILCLISLFHHSNDNKRKTKTETKQSKTKKTKTLLVCMCSFHLFLFAPCVNLFLHLYFFFFYFSAVFITLILYLLYRRCVSLSCARFHSMELYDNCHRAMNFLLGVSFFFFYSSIFQTASHKNH